MSTLCLVVVGATQEKLAAFPFDSVRGEVDELIPVCNEGNVLGGYGTIANRMLDRTSCDVFGICHADTVFAPGDLTAFRDAALRGQVVGLVGRTLRGAYVWSYKIQAETVVSTLDACSIFFERRRGLRFDNRTFNTFHCCVEDVCLAATRKRIPVVVPVAPGARHLGDTAHSAKKKWVGEFRRYEAKLRAKYAGMRFKLTAEGPRRRKRRRLVRRLRVQQRKVHAVRPNPCLWPPWG